MSKQTETAFDKDGNRIPSDYVNATVLLKQHGKDISNYRTIKSVKRYFDAVGVETGLSYSQLMIDSPRTTWSRYALWVHPLIGLHLRQWLDAEFSVECFKKLSLTAVA